MERSKYFSIAAILLAIIVMIMAGSKQTVSTPNFTVETISALCSVSSSNSEKSDIQIKAEGNNIVVTAPVKTPTPCYIVAGNVKMTGKNIDIELTPSPKESVCIQCVGEVTAKVVVQNLTKGVYGVKLKIPDRMTTNTVIIR